MKNDQIWTLIPFDSARIAGNTRFTAREKFLGKEEFLIFSGEMETILGFGFGFRSVFNVDIFRISWV